MKLDGLQRGWLFFTTEEKKVHFNKQNERETARRTIQGCEIKNTFALGFPEDKTLRYVFLLKRYLFKMLLADSVALVYEETLINRSC